MKAMQNSSIVYGTDAERTAMNAADLGSNAVVFFTTDTNATYEWKGSEWEQTKTGGAKHVVLSGAYPSGGAAVTAASGNVAAAIAAATLPAVAAKTNYITGFEATGPGATLGSVVTLTVTGTISGTLSYTITVIAGALLGNTPLIVEFPVAIPASAENTAITVSMPSLGAGNTNATVVAHGYVV